MKITFSLLLLLITFSLLAKGPITHERKNHSKMKNPTTGRFMYVGDVPKFEGTEIEITISKINLTARVTAHVNQGRIDTYANQLFMRWKSISDAMMDPVFSLHPLVKLSKLAEGKPSSTVIRAKITEQYSSHILEKSGVDVYYDKRNTSSFENNTKEDTYKNRISEAYFKYLFGTTDSSDIVINDNLRLEQLLSVQNSRRLFAKHLGHLYTGKTERADYVGVLTLVYPIAATVAGPFDQPKEMITNFSPLDVWYLRRDYVSHGCHRMDSSDLLEMRALMPNDLKNAANKIKVTVLDYFDVVDWNKDGKLEAIDVKYYSIPTFVTKPKNKTIDEVIAPYLAANQQGTFIKNNKYAAPFYDAATDKLKKIPKYSIGKKVIAKAGVHDTMDIHRFEYRLNRILQYTEEGHKLMGFDDSFGKYPPKYFQRY